MAYPEIFSEGFATKGDIMRQVMNRVWSVCFAVSLMSGALIAKADDVSGVITGDENTSGDNSAVTPGIGDGSSPYCDAEGDHSAGFDDCHPNYCQNYNYNYTQCVRAGCQFDGRSGACVGGGYPQPGPSPYPQPQPNPYFCQQYNYNQYQCQQSGCFYDQRNGACTAQGGYPPGPPPGRGFVCTAVDAGFEEHGGGHQGLGRTQYEASNVAMGECLRFHGRCRVTQCRPM